MALGIQLEKEGISVSVVAKTVPELLLFFRNEEAPRLRLPFSKDRRLGEVYTLTVSFRELRAAGFRGAALKSAEYQFEADGKRFADPYGKSFSGHDSFGKALKEASVKRSPLFLSDFDWEEEAAPVIPARERVIYRLHVRGFTMAKNSGVVQRGTFDGIVEKLPYLKELGVTTLELLPAEEFEELPFGSARVNYWGYGETFHFAPKASYCRKRRRDPAGELRALVKALHAAGMELVMEFYFDGKQTVSYVLEVLRYYRHFYHLDGARLSGQFPLGDILRDPYLKGFLLFAEERPAESGANFYCCDRAFQQDMRKFLKGDEGMVRALLGYSRRTAGEAPRVNYLAHTNGFTLADLVCYERKHNEENGENNMDGGSEGDSWNCGVEGKTKRRTVLACRAQQRRNAFALLFLSQGTPLFLAGDEFGNSQGGNNNAYCQDNAVSWLDWRQAKQEAENLAFVRGMIAFRKAHPALGRQTPPLFLDTDAVGLPDVSYHGEQPWQAQTEPFRRQIGILYNGHYAKLKNGEADSSLFCIYNMHWEAHTFSLPGAGKGKAWHLAVRTYGETAHCLTPGEEERLEDQETFLLPARSIVVLLAKEVPTEGKTKRSKKRQGDTRSDGR